MTREERADASRRAIMDAALLLFANHGFSGTSTRSIAKAAHVSEGLIFHHFPSKQDLLRAIVQSRPTMPSVVSQLIANAHATPIEQFVTSVARTFVRLLRPGTPEAQLFRVLLGESHQNAELHSVMWDLQSAILEAMAGYFRSRVSAGEVREDLPADAAARCLAGSFVTFFVINHRLDAETWDERATVHAEGVVDFWLRGALSDARRATSGTGAKQP